MAKTDWEAQIGACIVRLMCTEEGCSEDRFRHAVILELLREFAEAAAEMTEQRGWVYGGELARAIRNMLPPKEED